MTPVTFRFRQPEARGTVIAVPTAYGLHLDVPGSYVKLPRRCGTFCVAALDFFYRSPFADPADGNQVAIHTFDPKTLNSIISIRYFPDGRVEVEDHR